MRSFFANHRTGHRNKSSHNASWSAEIQHPDLPSPRPFEEQQQQRQQHQRRHDQQPQQSSPNPSPRPLAALRRSASVLNDRSLPTNRSQPTALDQRRSIILPAVTSDFTPSIDDSPDDTGHQQVALAGGRLSRTSTVLRRETAGHHNYAISSNSTPTSPEVNPSQHSNTAANTWSPDFAQLPATPEREESASTTVSSFFDYPSVASHTTQSASMSAGQQHNAGNTPGKTSSDSGPQVALDRWSQRRLQRLNTEQGFREQRQGGHGVLSPPPPNNASSSISSGSSEQPAYNTQYPNQDAQPQKSLQHQQSQPHPAQQNSVGYQASRTAPANLPNVGLAIQTPSSTNNTNTNSAVAGSRQAEYQQPHAGQYSPPEAHFSHDPSRPPLTQSRSYSQPGDESAMSNNGPLQGNKRSGNGNNRQSVHNGLTSREGSHSTQGGQVPAFNTAIVPPGSQGGPYKGNQQQQQQQQQGDVTRGTSTPQPQQLGDEMSDEDVAQLVKDHKELREKYTKVKKYYFEKEDQVKQLQNSLAHQRLSQSKTSLDDSEYTTRFNRLDGLVAQLAFSIRKSWKSIPQWLVTSVNRDAVATGKQEMTAAGRAFISCWLVEEVFDKYFHPDLEPGLSTQLKTIQKNIRKFAPVSQTVEEEEYLISKVVNWRLATLEGLQERLRSPSCPENRQKLIDTLKDGLCAALSVHLQEPPPSDLEGGVHMIIELVVSIAIHLPLESRDVAIEYFMPNYSIMTDQMKLESGIPPLTTSVADDTAERASMKSATSDVTDMTENSNADQPSKKRSMLSALTGTGKGHKAQGKHATGSSSSLNRPGSSQDMKEDSPPRVRMAAGIGVSVRGRSVLVKAPVFST